MKLDIWVRFRDPDMVASNPRLTSYDPDGRYHVVAFSNNKVRIEGHRGWLKMEWLSRCYATRPDPFRPVSSGFIDGDGCYRDAPGWGGHSAG